MFGGFESRSDRPDRHAQKRFAVTTGVSIALYATVGAAALAVTRGPETVAAARELAVVFRPPPPPPPPVVNAPPVAVPRNTPVRRVSRPAPRPQLVAPERIPEQKPEEVAPEDATPVEIGEGEGAGDENSVAAVAPPAPSAPPPPPPVPVTRERSTEPINLPEGATPPVPDASNVSPEYPEQARAQGLEGQVILRIIVSDKGQVSRVEILRGDEPFVGAATAAVRTWRFSAAIVSGTPRAVYRILKIPFRLKS